MGFGTLMSDLKHDIKSSWRFKVAALLWLPFFIVICVGVGKFDIKMQASENVPGWRVAIMHEGEINYPQITFLRDDGWPYFTSPIVCSQGNSSVSYVPCDGLPSTTCQKFNTQQIAARLQQGTQANQIVCNLKLNPNSTLSSDFSVSFPGGWTDVEQIYVTPGKSVGVVQFSKTTFDPNDADPIDLWRGELTYGSAANPNFDATVAFRVSAFDIMTYTEYIWFDRWQFQGAFGGIVFFYWIWFQLIYRFLKNFLPNDSKLFGTEPPVGPPAQGYAQQTDVP